MTTTPSFTELLDLVADRSAALRATAEAAPDLDAKVPSCPEWTLRDLVAHLGRVHRFWAADVRADRSDAPPSEEAAGDVPLHGDLLAWSAESTEILLGALRAVGPDRPCWTWWRGSGAAGNSGAVARHQVQEAAVHAYDAQLTVGRPEPLPRTVALDGIDEFIAVQHGSSGPWPHHPAHVELRTEEGPAWLLSLGPDGVATAPTDPAGPPADAVLRAPASDLLLVLHGRAPLDRLHLAGDRSPALAERLLAWPDLT